MRAFVASILGALLIFASTAKAQTTAATRSATTKPTSIVKSSDCVTSECHINVKAQQVKHGPVTTNNCDACHELKSAKDHKFAATRQKAELCTYCHEFSMSAMPVLHKPAKEGECLGCHDPHGGNSKALLREETISQLCARCHESVTKNMTFVHGPVSKGQCDSCHTPHGSRFPKLLDVVGSDMCLTCHVEFEPAVADAKFKHKALDEGCQKCHGAHGSNNQMSLLQPARDLCLSCHEKTKKQVESATVKHDIVTKDRACLNCHGAHASNVGKLLAEPSAISCLKCHKQDVKNERGQVIAAVTEISATDAVKHGEIREGQCGSCHEVHGSTRDLLLARNYSKSLYQHFDPADYELCFGCHDVKAVQETKTDKLTSFRNGDVNLHFIHANRGRLDKNCRACHVTHAGANPRLIRVSLQYGKWAMPLRYEKTETGGRCAPGCHGPWAYDRLKPAVRPTTVPATLPAPILARAEKEEAQVVRWQPADVTGTIIPIPDDLHPTALVLLSSEDLDREKVIAPLKTAISDKIPSQVVVIISGPGAQKQAEKLVADNALPWPIVADEKHGASEALGVRGWPVVLVLRPDGTEIARVTGKTTFLAAKLPVYLSFASGKIDRAALDKHLNTHAVEEDDHARRMAREIRLAGDLLKQNKPQEALSILERDDDATPERRAAIGEALLMLNKPKDVLERLAGLEDEALPNAAVPMLRAKAYAAMEKPELALNVLEQAAQKHPDVAELHDLLGRIFEQSGDTGSAVKHYRIASDLAKKSPQK